MKHHYREIQYFHPLFYLATGLACASSIFLSIGLAATGTSTAGSIVLVIVGSALLLLLATLGRMVVDVDASRLQISFGWIRLVRKTFELKDVGNARVCIFKPLVTYLGWGWRYGLDGSSCYTTRSRRGVEITVGQKRSLIGSSDPQMLKDAMLRHADPIDDRPEYLRESVVLPKRRPPSRYRNWGLINPQEVRSLSA